MFYSTLQGSTPLHVAVMGGHTDCVKKLMLAPGIDANIKNNDGKTPVMLASGNYEILKVLRSCSEFPVHTFSKVILCGNSGAGKSTLAQVCACLIRACCNVGIVSSIVPTSGLVPLPQPLLPRYTTQWDNH